jgi:3-deoxy-manno-octulosonate cytidylyltransferase (CMP-KDO synthetase)
MASQRLPGKPLLDIAGEPLIRRVYRQACKAEAREIVIATDDHRIAEAAEGFGARVVLTAADHESGSDRIAECARRMCWADDEVIVNLQGDEPLMPPACLDQVAGLLSGDETADVASLYWPVHSREEADDPNVVKVVTDRRGYALYFSRSLLPYPRSMGEPGATEAPAWKRHIGLYAYRVGVLQSFTSMAPSPLETTERLEQLRFLEAGRRINMARAMEPIPPGVDTPEDLQRIRAHFLG